VGNNYPFLIGSPRGTLVPCFETRPHGQTTDAAIDGLNPDISVKSFWPSVLIRPLSNLSGNPEFDFWGIGLATELADELNHYPDIRVITLSPVKPNMEVEQTAARFVIDGSVRSDGICIKTTVQLTDTRTGRLIWSESCRSLIETARLMAFQEDVARGVAVKVAGQHGWIAKSLDKKSNRRPPQHSEVYEALLRYYEYDLTMTPESFSRALAPLKKAVTIDPGFCKLFPNHRFAQSK
jgi:adenylate cyclase